MNKIITPQEFNFIWLYKIKKQKRKSGNQGTTDKKIYKDLITAFDIETTRIKEIEQSVMYVWQFQFDLDYTIIGRTWKEFIDFIKQIKNVMQPQEYIVVYVHNLSYEFQFLRGIYDFQPEEVFAIKSRKILKCEMFNCIELRCSYLHSNMSLDMYTEKMNVEHKKLSGTKFDYDKQRFYFTELTNYEKQYITNDVLGLVEGLKKEMEFDNDNLYTIPLTSTGYVRRDAKKAMRQVSHNYIKQQLPNYETYELLREAFRGGNTHANRFFSNQILHNVKSADRSSSYPDVLCNCEFPISKFFDAGKIDFNELLELINIRKKAVLMRVSISNLKLINEFWGFPYLSTDKCRNIKNAIYDNCRILKADYLETTITDIDLKIILSEYDFSDLCPIKVMHARYGKLPPQLIKTIINYYKLKTTLKGNKEQELYYMKSKNKLNSIYGMMAQDPVKQSIDYIGESNKLYIEEEIDPELLLGIYNGKAFLCYQWGVWDTANSRLRLEEGLQLAGNNGVYCDTDSVKYIGEIDWNMYNKQRIQDSKNSGAYANDFKGITHYMGVFEQEHDMCEFATMGAKKYCYRETTESELITTIAGVSKFAKGEKEDKNYKMSGGEELEKNGGIKAFKTGFIFKDAGGTEAIYNDNPEIKEYTIDNYIIPITSNVVIKESTYKLGMTEEYIRLLENPKFYIDIQ